MNQAAAQLSPNASSNAKLVGIGGWLLLLIIKLWFGAAVRVLGGIAEPNHLLALLNFGFAALAGIGAYLLGRKNPTGVMLAKIFLAAEGVYYVLELLPPASVDNPFKTAGFLTASVLYFIYLFRSKRVKNTYFPEPLAHAPAPSVAVNLAPKGDDPMSKKAKGKPWYSKEGTVHHDNSMCDEGKKILQRLEGTGQKPLCPECGRLNNLP
ncbi:MAG TPA: hypothetical protein VNE63_09930 [Candidatus Acidoferrales bacterium]|nr:hypothetical protein [Candidatus Acidoferrales bacterium]